MKYLHLLLQILRFTVGTFLLVTLAWYLWHHQQEIARLGQFSLMVLVLIFAARLAAYIMLVASTWWVTSHYAPNLGRWEYFFISANGSALGTFGMPGSSYAVKTIYLKQRHGLKHVDFFGINIVVGLMALIGSGILACAALGMLWFSGNSIHPMLLTLAVCMLIGPFVALLILNRPLTVLSIERLTNLSKTCQEILSDRNRLIWAFTGLIVRSGFSFLGFGLLFYELGGGTVLTGGVMDSLSTILRLVHLTPSNIGVYEWLIAGIGRWLDASLTVGLLAAALYRLTGVVVITTSASIGQLITKFIQP